MDRDKDPMLRNGEDESQVPDRLFRSKWAHFAAWYLFPTVLVLIVAALIAMSRLDLETSLYVFGQGDGKGRALLLPGRPNALRLAIYNRTRSRFVFPIEAKVRLETSTTGRQIYAGWGREAIQVNFRLGRIPNGPATLDVRACGPGGCRHARVPAFLSGDAPALLPVSLDGQDTIPEWEAPRAGPEGVVLELLPQGGWSLPGELPAKLVLRATDVQGVPRPVIYRVRLLRGVLSKPVPPGSVLVPWTKSGPDGMGTFQVVTRRRLLSLEVQYRTTPMGPIHAMRFDTVSRPAPLALLKGLRILKPGQKQVLHVESLTQEEPLYVDGYGVRGLNWVGRSEVHGGKGRVEARAPSEEGLWLLEVYPDLVAPGQAMSVWASFVSKENELDGPAAGRIVARVSGILERWSRVAKTHMDVAVANQALRKATSWEAQRLRVLGQWVRDKGPETARRVVDYALGRLQGFTFQPQVLADTYPGERARLLAAKRRYQNRLLALLGLGVAVLLLMVGLVILRNIQHARRAQQLMEEIASETSDVEDSDVWRTDLGPKEPSRVVFWLHSAALVFAILFAVVSVMVLVSNLMWGLKFK